MKGVCKKRDENGSNGKWKSSIKILGQDKGRVKRRKIKKNICKRINP